MTEKVKLTARYEEERTALLPKEPSKASERLQELREAAESVRSYIRFFANQQASVTTIAGEIKNLRQNEAPAALRTLQSRHQRANLADEQWKRFLLDYTGDVDGAVTAKASETETIAQADTWNRGGVSGAVYVPAGEALPGASLQVGLIVSTEHTTGNRLLAWIREQSLASASRRYHEGGTNSETCVVGVSGARTYMALQLCKTGDARAACIESDRVLDHGVFSSCLNNVRCFDAACSRRWFEERTPLDRVLAAVVPTAR